MGGEEAGGSERRAGRPAAEPHQRAEAQHPLVDEAERAAAAVREKLAGGPGGDAIAAAVAADAARAAEAERVPGAGGAAGAGGGRGGERARAARVLGRAAGTAARAGETLRPGVDRLRGTLVAFDEAASDDPGLRFVVAAAVLFLVFLLLWFVSFFLG